MADVNVEPVIDISNYSIAQIRELQSGEKAAPETVEKAPSEAAAEPAVESIAAESDTAKTEELEAEKEIAKPTPGGKGLQKRFSTLTKTIRDLEAENASLKASKPEIKQAAATPEPVKIEAAPKSEDFTTWEEYSDAVVRHQFKAAKAEEVAAQQTALAQQQRSELEARLTAQTAEARTKHADFDAIALNPKLPVTPVMLHVLQSGDNGAELLYHLGQHPEVAAAIAQMKPGAAALALGRLSAKLFPDTDPEPVVKEAAKAEKVLPKPVSTVGTGGTAPLALDDENLPLDDFLARFRKKYAKG